MFPVPQCMHANTHCLGKLGLRKADKSPKSGDITAGLDLAEDETLANPSRNCPGKLLVSEFRYVCRPILFARVSIVEHFQVVVTLEENACLIK